MLFIHLPSLAWNRWALDADLFAPRGGRRRVPVCGSIRERHLIVRIINTGSPLVS